MANTQLCFCSSEGLNHSPHAYDALTFLGHSFQEETGTEHYQSEKSCMRLQVLPGATVSLVCIQSMI